MEIVAALFIENINVRQLFDGGPTRIDLSGVQFSLPAPQPVPVTITPHLVVLVRCPADHGGQGTLETSFRDTSGKEVARNAQPLQKHRHVHPARAVHRMRDGLRVEQRTRERFHGVDARMRRTSAHRHADTRAREQAPARGNDARRAADGTRGPARR